MLIFALYVVFLYTTLKYKTSYTPDVGFLSEYSNSSSDITKFIIPNCICIVENVSSFMRRLDGFVYVQSCGSVYMLTLSSCLTSYLCYKDRLVIV
jgi:hypothetical protein